MNFEKVVFKNNAGETLSGRIELPADQHPHSYAVFAHCFTCTKNLSAVKNISRALTMQGFGVLRFDFTGLGESDGDFEDTNFSGNVEDLCAAAEFLSEKFSPPTLLVGHSLGGAAVIFAAARFPSVKAVATIGAPSNPAHVKHLLQSELEIIEEKGLAEVKLSGRNFTIKKQFLDDLEKQSLPQVAKELNKALLILHSPQDKLVAINNAEEIYHAARHPKSFITLDGADHLLSKKEDSVYVGNVIGAWVARYLTATSTKNKTINTKHDVVASLVQSDGFTTKMKLGKHNIIADEPESFGGNDFGPTPYELLSAGLSACTAMTIQMYARRKKWAVDKVEVHTSYDKTHAIDCENCEAENTKIDTFTRAISFTGELDSKQKTRLLEIADKCPVHKTLQTQTQIITNLMQE